MQVETANNESEEDDMGDWEIIEYDDASVKMSSQRRPPDFMNDPFKDKWKNTVQAITSRSKYG